jgi:hypothetical protein
MARQLLVLDEVLAMLDVVGASASLREKFTKQAQFVLSHRNTREAATSDDTIEVASGYGAQGAHVEFSLNETRTQMPPAKAREVGLMLLEAAEAAISDHVVMTLLRERVGVTDEKRLAAILLDVREIRQGTRGVSRPS